jgi:fatty acid desaturase
MTAKTDIRLSGPQGAYVSTYAALTRRVQAADLQRRRYGYYWGWIAGSVLAFVAIWVAVVMVGDSWWQLAIAAGLAVVMSQLGFLGHDAAHRQIFVSPRWNEWMARVLSGALTGLSYGWWLRKHNRHHSAPNQEGRDPDIDSGVLALTPSTAAGRKGFAGWFTRRQGWWLFLLLPFEGVNLHVQSVFTVLGRRPVKRRAVEVAFLALRLGGYLAALGWLLPPGKAAAFAAVQLAVFGVLLGGAFTPNHIGMPVVPAGMKVDFLRRQVLMSRNIAGGLGIDLLMGGLNHQIEHHLFPNMPRPNLRRARPLVRAHCAELGVTYTETGLVPAFRAVVRYLNAVGMGGADPFHCPLVTLYRA